MGTGGQKRWGQKRGAFVMHACGPLEQGRKGGGARMAKSGRRVRAWQHPIGNGWQQPAGVPSSPERALRMLGYRISQPRRQHLLAHQHVGQALQHLQLHTGGQRDGQCAPLSTRGLKIGADGGSPAGRARPKHKAGRASWQAANSSSKIQWCMLNIGHSRMRSMPAPASLAAARASSPCGAQPSNTAQPGVPHLLRRRQLERRRHDGRHRVGGLGHVVVVIDVGEDGHDNLRGCNRAARRLQQANGPGAMSRVHATRLR